MAQVLKTCGLTPSQVRILYPPLRNRSNNFKMSQKIYLLILLILVKSLYVPLNRRKSRFYWKISLDDRIPLISWFVIPYIGFYLYIIIAVSLLWNTHNIKSLLASYLFAYTSACIFWYLFPNGVKRPEIVEKNIFDRITVYIYSKDYDTNGFPSAHIFTTLICAYFLSITYPAQSLTVWISAFLIGISTVLIKQHYIMDVLGGIILFLITLFINF